MMRIVWGCAVVVLFVLGAAPARAQTVGTPPDIVRLNDGSFFRGTIVESTPEHVVLTSPTGESREFARADVASAGPDAPPQPIVQPIAPPMVVQAPDMVPTTHLHATADADDLSLARLTGSSPIAVPTSRGMAYGQLDQFAVICNLPCDVEMPAGTYQLGVGHGTGQPSRRGRPITFTAGDFPLDVHFTDRNTIRIAGWITMIGGMVAGGALLCASVIVGGDSHYDYVTGTYGHDVMNVPMAIAGGAVFLVGGLVGLLLAVWNDGVEFSSNGVAF